MHGRERLRLHARLQREAQQRLHKLVVAVGAHLDSQEVQQPAHVCQVILAVHALNKLPQGRAHTRGESAASLPRKGLTATATHMQDWAPKIGPNTACLRRAVSGMCITLHAPVSTKLRMTTG